MGERVGSIARDPNTWWTAGAMGASAAGLPGLSAPMMAMAGRQGWEQKMQDYIAAQEKQERIKRQSQAPPPEAPGPWASGPVFSAKGSGPGPWVGAGGYRFPGDPSTRLPIPDEALTEQERMVLARGAPKEPASMGQAALAGSAEQSKLAQQRRQEEDRRREARLASGRQSMPSPPPMLSKGGGSVLKQGAVTAGATAGGRRRRRLTPLEEWMEQGEEGA